MTELVVGISDWDESDKKEERQLAQLFISVVTASLQKETSQTVETSWELPDSLPQDFIAPNKKCETYIKKVASLHADWEAAKVLMGPALYPLMQQFKRDVYALWHEEAEINYASRLYEKAEFILVWTLRRNFYDNLIHYYRTRIIEPRKKDPKPNKVEQKELAKTLVAFVRTKGSKNSKLQQRLQSFVNATSPAQTLTEKNADLFAAAMLTYETRKGIQQFENFHAEYEKFQEKDLLDYVRDLLQSPILSYINSLVQSSREEKRVESEGIFSRKMNAMDYEDIKKLFETFLKAYSQEVLALMAKQCWQRICQEEERSTGSFRKNEKKAAWAKLDENHFLPLVTQYILQPEKKLKQIMKEIYQHLDKSDMSRLLDFLHTKKKTLEKRAQELAIQYQKVQADFTKKQEKALQDFHTAAQEWLQNTTNHTLRHELPGKTLAEKAEKIVRSGIGSLPVSAWYDNKEKQAKKTLLDKALEAYKTSVEMHSDEHETIANFIKLLATRGESFVLYLQDPGTGKISGVYRDDLLKRWEWLEVLLEQVAPYSPGLEAARRELLDYGRKANTFIESKKGQNIPALILKECHLTQVLPELGKVLYFIHDSAQEFFLAQYVFINELKLLNAKEQNSFWNEKEPFEKLFTIMGLEGVNRMAYAIDYINRLFFGTDEKKPREQGKMKLPIKAQENEKEEERRRIAELSHMHA